MLRLPPQNIAHATSCSHYNAVRSINSQTCNLSTHRTRPEQQMTRVMQPFQCDLQTEIPKQRITTHTHKHTQSSFKPPLHCGKKKNDKPTAAATVAHTRYISSPAAATLHGKTQGFVLRLPPQNIAHATFMQPFHCDLPPQLQETHRTTHTGTTIRCKTRIHASSPLPFVITSQSLHFPSSPLPFITTSLRHHFPSSPPYVIATTSHVPTSLPHHSPSSPLPFLTTSLRHHFSSSPLPFLTTSLRHHFPPSPFPFLTTSLPHHLPSSPLPFITTSLRHHFPSSPLPIVTTSLPHHSPSSPLPFVTTSLPHHFPSSPLPIVPTSLPHHFPSSPLPIVTTSLRHHPVS